MSNQDKYQIELISDISKVTPSEWNAFLDRDSSPFLKHEFLHALEITGCVGGETGWQISHILLKEDECLIGAMPLYLKYHSYGEYVFDWAWAQAYEQHGLDYFPKVLCAIPFTPVQGSRILCRPSKQKDHIKKMIIHSLKEIIESNNLSSAHILFPHKDEIELLHEENFLIRDAVQFHWQNQNYVDFDDFLSQLIIKRRKNIRRERRAIANSGITFRHITGACSEASDWDFFYKCYQNTYTQHRSSPYLNRAFFLEIAERMPQNIHLVIAEEAGSPIASSLAIIDPICSKAYGRYWGAVKHVPYLHFETAYYQLIDYCIDNEIQIFEGGAQGEHKMARGFLPKTIQSAHFIRDPQFANAIQHFLNRESAGVSNYITELSEHHPLLAS